jgi:hypothetical protein
MALIYLIVDKEDRIPVLTATTMDKSKLLLDEYMGLGFDKEVEYIGFFPYDTEYTEIYEGVYKYKSQYGIQEFIRYCMPIDEVI